MHETNHNELIYVIEHINTISGDLWHEVSATPQRSHRGAIKTITLGIGKVDSLGRIQPVRRADVDKESLSSFLLQTQQLLNAA